MAVSPQGKLKFSCTATSTAAKTFPKWRSIIPLLKTSTKEVMRLELPEIRQLKLGIVLMTDEELLEMNKRVMKHDFYTDILTFEIEREEDFSEAELYFSIDRARENALRYKVTLRNELARLAIHGMLHLANYDDKKPSEKKKMREREKFFLAYLQSERSIEY